MDLFLKGKAKKVIEELAIKTTLGHKLDELKLSKEQALRVYYDAVKGGDTFVAYGARLAELLGKAMPGLTIENQLPMLKQHLQQLGLSERLLTVMHCCGSLDWDRLMVSLDNAAPALGLGAGSSGAGYGASGDGYHKNRLSHIMSRESKEGHKERMMDGLPEIVIIVIRKGIKRWRVGRSVMT